MTLMEHVYIMYFHIPSERTFYTLEASSNVSREFLAYVQGFYCINLAGMLLSQNVFNPNDDSLFI